MPYTIFCLHNRSLLKALLFESQIQNCFKNTLYQVFEKLTAKTSSSNNQNLACFQQKLQNLHHKWNKWINKWINKCNNKWLKNTTRNKSNATLHFQMHIQNLVHQYVWMPVYQFRWSSAIIEVLSGALTVYLLVSITWWRRTPTE